MYDPLSSGSVVYHLLQKGRAVHWFGFFGYIDHKDFPLQEPIWVADPSQTQGVPPHKRLFAPSRGFRAKGNVNGIPLAPRRPRFTPCQRRPPGFPSLGFSGFVFDEIKLPFDFYLYEIVSGCPHFFFN
jgi:hypothetical protein